MKECSKCGELNGDNNTVCYKCRNPLGNSNTMGKICRKCNIKYSSRIDTCPECGGYLSLYEPTYELKTGKNNGNTPTWMYICTIFIPILGVILGCIKLKEDEFLAKNLIILGIVLMVIYAIISGVFIGCSTRDAIESAKEANSYIDEVSRYLRDHN